MEKYYDLNGIKILLVEDNKFYQLLTKRVLEKAGYVLHLAENGKEALEKIEREIYALVLMDLQMPEMNGYEATRLIRCATDRRINKIPIIAMTAHDVNEEGPGCILAGMNDYISKPFEAQVLYQKINNLITETKNAISEKSMYETSELENKAILDLRYLKEILGDSDEVLAEVLSTLYEQLPIQTENLKKSAANKNWKQVGQDAHKMRSCIMMLSMPDFLSEIKVIEKNANEEINLEMLSGLVEQAVSTSYQVISLVKGELEKLQCVIKEI